MVMRERRYTRLLDQATGLFPAASILPHLYDREPTKGTPDPYGETTYTFDTKVTRQHCQIQENPLQGVDQGGNPTVVNVVQLLVPADDPLATGDRVSNITTRKGVVLESGPVIVDTVRDVEPWGGAIYHLATMKRLSGTG